MKRFLTRIIMMVLMIPSVVCANNNGIREADTVADVIARTISNNEVEVIWSWNKLIPPAVVIDFETADFSQANFTNDADYPWEITQDAYEGTYAAKSTNSGVNNSNHFMEITVEAPYDGIMSFYHKVESELDFDGGLFFIDGQRMTSITGIKDWEYVELPITAGVHTYSWSYTKDFYGDEGEVGSDSYYVDNIVPYAPKEELAEGWLYYDDGYLLNATGMGQEGADNYWAVCFPDMSAYAGQTLSKVATMLYQGTNATVSVCLGGTAYPGTVMATKTFSVTPQEVVEIELDAPVAIDGTKPLWIVMHNNDAANPAAASAYCGDPNGSWFMLQGGWYDVAMIGVSPRTWIIRAYVEDEDGRTVAISQGDFNPVNDATAEDKVMSLTPERGMIVGTPTRAYRNEYTYNLYKKNVFTGTEPELIEGNLTDTTYIDNSWSTYETGLYQWGVEVATNNNRAPIVWSNILEKDMFTTVEVKVELNTDESATGTEVTLVNLNEPEYNYDVRLGKTGTYTWNEFRRGTYEYSVHKRGYESSVVSEVVEILDETSLTCTLTEIISPATDLYVSPTGWAMWEGEQVSLEGDEFLFDFEDGTTNGWVHIDVDGDGLKWANTNEYLAESLGYESSQCILSASYNNTYGALKPDNYIITAEKYLIGDMSQLTFVVKPMDPDYIAEHYGVAISTKGNTSPDDFEMIWEETISTTDWKFKTIDLSEYSGTEVYVALRHFDCTDNYMVIIDNVALINTSKSSRNIESYTVMLNGDEEATVEKLNYRHKDITPGETYTTTVIANFASGSSDPVEYTWTAVACDEYDGVSDLAVKYISGDEALLTWTLPADALGALVYRDGELLTDEILNDEAYSDPLTAAGTFNYCVEAVYEDYVTSCLQCEEFEYDGVAVKENDANAMRIYPNPVKDNLTITAESMTRITITNTLGQVMLDENVASDSEVINMSQYEAGVYVVRITTESGVAVERITVVK